MDESRFAPLAESQTNRLTLDISVRKAQLKRLLEYFKKNAAELAEAVHNDFTESSLAEFEVQMVIRSGELILMEMDSWITGEKVSQPGIVFISDKAMIHYDPLGVVLVIGAWNVPMLTLFPPVFGAIAAGCSVTMKPSEMCANLSKFLMSTIPEYLDPRIACIVTGGPEETSRLVQDHAWDMVFFTGSIRVGRLIYEQAAKKMIPCVLELGGKSPVIVTDSCGDGLQLAADRIAWGKLYNAGQICIGPDYLLVEEAVYDRFIECLKASFSQFSGECSTPEMSKIVTEQHWKRLDALAQTCGGTKIYEAHRNQEERYFGPLVVVQPDLDSPLMNEEIFGPILPILKVRSHTEAIAFINARPKPLIAYIFSKSQSVIDEVKLKTRSGSFMANDLHLIYGAEALPFGGVGASGMGAYHGKVSFTTFSHAKSCLQRRLALGWIDKATRFPPMTKEKLARLMWLSFEADSFFRRTGIALLVVALLLGLILGLAIPLS